MKKKRKKSIVGYIDVLKEQQEDNFELISIRQFGKFQFVNFPVVSTRIYKTFIKKVRITIQEE